VTQPVTVECREAGDGWVCRVTVGDDAGSTTHEVTVSRDVLARLRPDDTAPDQLVSDAFAFLLAREPRDSILRSFDLPVIGRYFHEWEAEIRKGPGES
jgi:hypothetical protein